MRLARFFACRFTFFEELAFLAERFAAFFLRGRAGFFAGRAPLAAARFPLFFTPFLFGRARRIFEKYAVIGSK